MKKSDIDKWKLKPLRNQDIEKILRTMSEYFTAGSIATILQYIKALEDDRYGDD